MARGNPGKKKINKNEPVPKANKIEPPEYVSGKALEKWNEIVPGLMESGVVTNADVETLGRYCAMYEQWLKYLDQCRKGLDVLVIRDDNGKVKYMQQSPAATMQMKLAASMLRIEQEFGLTPSARTGISATDAKPDNDFEKWRAS